MTRIGLSGGHVRGQVVIRSRFFGCLLFFGEEATASRSKGNSFLGQRQQLPPASGRVTFFCHKQQKKGNQRKMLCCESSARKCGAPAGTRHTGHPCPGGARRASCTPPFGCAFANASYRRRSAGGELAPQAQAQAVWPTCRSGASRDRETTGHFVACGVVAIPRSRLAPLLQRAHVALCLSSKPRSPSSAAKSLTRENNSTPVGRRTWMCAARYRDRMSRVARARECIDLAGL